MSNHVDFKDAEKAFELDKIRPSSLYKDTLIKIDRLNELSDKRYILKISRDNLKSIAEFEKKDNREILIECYNIDNINTFLDGLIRYIKFDGSSLYFKEANKR